jgi:pimeloyl-ACP methyl ester carboxylesterase
MEKSGVTDTEFTARPIAGSRGAMLNCAHSAIDRQKPSLLIALPFGVPVTVAKAAFSTLQADFNVVTWESRFVLNLAQAFSGEEVMAPDAHVEDILCILASLALDSCHLIGYCSGAGISLLAASRHPETIRSLILVNGEYQLFRKGHVATVYQRSIDAFLPVVAKSRQQAGQIFAKMAETSNPKAGNMPAELALQINLPFSRQEHLFRYAKNYVAYRDFDALAVANAVRQPVFVLSGGRDEHSDKENSQAVAGALKQAITYVADQGDHYEFCRTGSPTLAEVGAYLRQSVLEASA